MNSILYVLKKEFKNKWKKAVRKPSFYVYVLILVFYAVIMYQTFRGLVVDGGFGTPKVLTMVLTGLVLYFTPMNYVAYAKHKGLRFLPAHVHFMFPAPVSPKFLLLFGQFQTQILSFLLELVVVFFGITWFHIPPVRMLLYFFCVSCLSMVFEGSLVVCLYGNERFRENTMKRLGSCLWLVLGVLAAVTALYLMKFGFHFQSVLDFLLSDWICYLPALGWQIALIRLTILGPSFSALFGSGCYLIWGIFLTVCAVKMKCTGRYYEDAMQFADDFQKVMEKRKKGDTSTGLKHGKVNRGASVTYKGSGAKAIFYRQLLEYKKSRFFLFGGQTLVSLVVAVGFPVLTYLGEIRITGVVRYYAIFGVMAYIYLIFSNIQTKWEKELENPYVYLIPAGNFSKMWYATVLEHIRVMIDAAIMVVPYCLVTHLPLYYIPVAALGGISMRAVKLYADTLCNVIIGQSLGNTARQLLRMFISWTIICVAVPIVVVVQFLISPIPAVLCGCAYLIAAAGMLMLGGSHAFSRMELRD